MTIENTSFGTESIEEFMRGCKNVFFIGIGGISMSSLAHMTKDLGFGVSGSDKFRTAICEKIENLGIKVFRGHRKENIEGADVVVYTVAISDDNPEYVAAKSRGIPCVSRADYMEYLMSHYKNRIGICGTHGKSTCTSMCAQIFIDSGRDPTVLSGAEFKKMDGAYRVGRSENVIFEACEYKDSFLKFDPTAAIILNIDYDHVDYFSSIGQMKESFANFLKKRNCRIIIANFDDENIRNLAPNCGKEVISFGIDNKEAEFYADNIRDDEIRNSFDIMRKGEFVCNIRLKPHGKYHIYDALASFVLADRFGIETCVIKAALDDYSGACRRMESKGKLNGADVYSDYGHHPTEIFEVLTAARRVHDCRRKKGRLVCVFQSHTYSRTSAFLDKFRHAFEPVDKIIVADIYDARAEEEHKVDARKLAEAIGENAEFVGGTEDIARYLNGNICEEDSLVVMGAGDIEKVFDGLNLE